MVGKPIDRCGHYIAHAADIQAMVRAIRGVSKGVEANGSGSRFETPHVTFQKWISADVIGKCERTLTCHTTQLHKAAKNTSLDPDHHARFSKAPSYRLRLSYPLKNLSPSSLESTGHRISLIIEPQHLLYVTCPPPGP